MKRPTYQKIFFGSLALMGAVQPAHAGLSDMINNVFTFREEQQDLIRPNYTLPPKHVLVPYYDEHQAAKWSNYYTRNDLKAQKHMDDSSMVMRPAERRPARDIPQGSSENRHVQQGAQRQYTGQNDRLGQAKPSALGYEAIARRDHLNRLQSLEGNVFVGEPGMAPHLDHNAGAQVGKKLQIGAPKRAWDDSRGSDFADARPGDYNYKSIDVGAPRETIDASEGYAQRRTTGYSKSSQRTFAERSSDYSLSIEAPSAPDLPTSYVVEKGDTLSGISGKDRIYGDWKLWPIIYDANRGQIQDPDLIHPKQDLGIPRGYDTSEESYARQRALAKKPPYSFYDNK